MSFDQIKSNLEKTTGTLQKAILTVLAIEGEKSIKKNFEVGGRPAWLPSKKPRKYKNTKTLVISGNLSNVSAEPDFQNLQIKFLPNPLTRAYARIHQEGGTINHPGGSRKLKAGKTPGRTLFAKSTAKRIVKQVDIKPYTIKIPARPYLVIPAEDGPGILSQIQRLVKV